MQSSRTLIQPQNRGLPEPWFAARRKAAVATMAPSDEENHAWWRLRLTHEDADHNLVVHPLNQYDFWRCRDTEATRDAMAPSAAPDKGVLVGVPVLGGTLHG